MAAWMYTGAMERASNPESGPSWTKGADGAWEIRLVLANAEQFYHSLDPSPFRDRDLDRDAAEFIIEEVEDLPRDDSIRLVLSVPDASKAQLQHAPQAVHHYFTRMAASSTRDLRRLFRIARRSMLIGMVFVVVVIAAARSLLPAAAEHTLLSAFLEGLTIVAWVGIWRPTEMFLYDWWPVRAKVSLYRRIARMPVVVETRDVR